MAEGGEEQTLRDWFKQALGSADHADQLAAVCERLDVDKHAYERIKRENDPLAQALLTYVISIMAERLRFASKVIGALRR